MKTREFGFLADGHEHTGNSSFVLSGSHVSAVEGGQLLKVDLSNVGAHLDVSVFYAVYDDHPAIRKWITTMSRSNTATYLSRFCFETLTAGSGPVSDLEVSGGYGERLASYSSLAVYPIRLLLFATPRRAKASRF